MKTSGITIWGAPRARARPATKSKVKIAPFKANEREQAAAGDTVYTGAMSRATYVRRTIRPLSRARNVARASVIKDESVASERNERRIYRQRRARNKWREDESEELKSTFFSKGTLGAKCWWRLGSDGK